VEGGEGGEEGSRRGRHEVERHFFFLLKNPDRLKKRTKDVRKNIVAKRTEQKKTNGKQNRPRSTRMRREKRGKEVSFFPFYTRKGVVPFSFEVFPSLSFSPRYVYPLETR
jgi:hypothetical protein